MGYKWDIDNDPNLSADELAFSNAIGNVKAMAEMLNKDSKIKKEWWCTSNTGMDNATVVAEHNEFSVRLFFEFTDTGFVYVSRHFTNGAGYDNDVIESWNYGKLGLDESFEKIMYVLENYFEEYNETRKEKTMKKQINEKKSDGWDYDEMLDEYGMNYLEETDPDNALYSMDDFNEIVGDDAMDAVRRAFNGYRYDNHNDPFNPNDDYFGYNGYANFISLDEYALHEYLSDNISEDDFRQWCVEYGYFEEESEE